MKILLTGATGFLGNNLLRMMLERGDTAACIIRTGREHPSLADLEFEAVYAELSQPETLNEDLPDFDVMIHSAALIQLGWSRLEESRRVNVASTRRLAEICRQRGRRLVHVSTVDTLGHSPTGRPHREGQLTPPKPACTYVITKSEAEQVVRTEIERGLDAIIVHPGFMVGPWDWKPSSGQMLLSVAKGLALLAPAGGCSAVDVRDVARGVLQAAESGRAGESYILGGENVTYLDLWRMMAEVAGSRPPRARLPNFIARTAGMFGDLAAKLTGREPLVNSASTAMGQLFHYYSSDKAANELGYTLNPLRQAVVDSWDWFRERKFVQ